MKDAFFAMISFLNKKKKKNGIMYKIKVKYRVLLIIIPLLRHVAGIVVLKLILHHHH